MMGYQLLLNSMSFHQMEWPQIVEISFALCVACMTWSPCLTVPPEPSEESEAEVLVLPDPGRQSGHGQG